jgi:hypothetical protein
VTTATSNGDAGRARAECVDREAGRVDAAASRRTRFGCAYVRSRAIWTALFGVIWSIFWYLWSVRHLPRMLDRAARVLGAEYEAHVARWKPRFRTIPIGWTALFAVLAVLYVALIVGFGWKPRALPFIEREWFTGTHILRKELVISLWAVATMLAVMPNIVGVYLYSRFIQGEGRIARETAPSIAAAREAHRRSAKFGVITGLAWTLAVVVVILGAVQPAEFDLGAAVIVGILGLFGFSLVFVPQWILHRSLREMRDHAVDQELEAFRRGDYAGPTATATLDTRLDALDREQTWVSGAGVLGAAALAVQLVLPLVSFLLSITIQSGANGG